MAVDIGRLDLHGRVRPLVGIGAESVARHCAHELIFVWGAVWLQIGMVNFTCTAEAVAGALESFARPSFKESLYAKNVSTRGVTRPDAQNCLGDVVRVSFRLGEA